MAVFFMVRNASAPQTVLDNQNIVDNKLEYIITQLYDKPFPLKRHKINIYKLKFSAWITNDILKSLKFRDTIGETLQQFKKNG